MDSKIAQGPPPYDAQGPPDYAHWQTSAIPVIDGGHNYATAVPLDQLTDKPAPVDCPICHQRAITNIGFKSGKTTKAWALGLGLGLGFVVPIVLGVPLFIVPFLARGTKDVVHKCARCQCNLARWHRSRGHAVTILAVAPPPPQ